MKVSCGTDIVNIERIKKAIEKHNEKFLTTVYTKQEVEYCEKHENTKYQHYAARFAAKEAFFKATSNISSENYVDWNNIEVINGKNGRPELNFKTIDNIEIQSIDLSLSHTDEYAIATVVILYNESL